ncbi:hypothetical protein [Paludibacter sp.]|uniref:hypothetical protein n=1 Tax=Paludibacter sp. TaxID=1898105 RepID=UPI0013539B85|nr:hypothetical protein [Paludibacter sp.]MTK54136.1 hypothetical protein [Paludibacter sp.]
MKTNSTKHWMKVAGLSLAIGTLALSANAQNTTTAIDKQASVVIATTPKVGAIRVVDNKGTIKYLQSKNGLTQITNTDPTNGSVVTTWQLGGTLTDNTYIDATGKIFGLDGITQAAATDAASAADLNAVHTGTTAGKWTLLVRDEATGAIKKLLFSDLAKGGQTSAKIGTDKLADGTTVSSAGADYTYTDATFPVDVQKVSVYRNGIKLLAGTDYSVSGLAGAATVTVKHASGTDPEDYSFIAGDRIEVQWVK